MERKRISIIGIIIVLLVVICIGGVIVIGQGEKIGLSTLQDSDQNDEMDISILQADIGTLPDSISRESVKMINAPWKQQYCYIGIKEDGTERVVLELSLISSDNEEEYRDESAFYESASDEAIYEWTQDGVACRVFGTFTEEELKNIAESVKVY